MSESEAIARWREDPVAGLLGVFDLTDTGARTTEDIFTASSHFMPSGRSFGGQVLAQSMLAASRTVGDDRVIHSMHGYFLRPGDASQDITLSGDRIHDGRSFSTRRTQAYQGGAPILSMIASFQVPDDGLEHAASFDGNVPSPEELGDQETALTRVTSFSGLRLTDRPIELRYVEGPVYLRVDGAHVPHQAVWARLRRPIGDDPLLHRAALAYLSDLSSQESILRAHGIAWATPGMKVASLDHAMWWHRDGRVDDWVLYAQESPNARGGRGLATGRSYTRDGDLLASTAQEVMVRLPVSDGARS